MGDLAPLAFDIETTGLEPDAVITVAGIAAELGAWLVLNTTGRHADAEQLTTTVEYQSGVAVDVAVVQDEETLLTALGEVADERIDGDRQYLTAFHGETWSGGYDLPMLRRACIRRAVDWPFPAMPYADIMEVIDRVETGDTTDLEGVYDDLVGRDHCDPFSDSGSAVAAHEQGEWVDLLLHNLADIQRTRELAVLAERFVPKSDFQMKNLAPPHQ